MGTWMTLLSWRGDFAVGVTLIDSEHRFLFDLINEFHDRYADNRTHREALLVLSRLVAYAEHHFRHEETLMSDVGYPRLAYHKGLHEALYTSIYAVHERLASGMDRIGAETLRFLKTWLVDHIVTEDVEIGDFMRRRARRPEGDADRSTHAENSEKRSSATQ